MRSEGAKDQPVTAIVRRRIKPGAERGFESLMQEFMTFVLRHPGHLGINVIRPSAGSSEYTVLDRFATEADRRRFTASREYGEWMSRLREVSEAEPDIDEMGGLTFWFTLPNRPLRKPPPKIKMAALTFLGVYPLSLLYPALLASITEDWSLWIRGALIAALLVASLTWCVMPALTGTFEGWLFPSDRKG
jgi:uncharacterized protein